MFKKQILFPVILPLIIGVTIYILFRNHNLNIFDWVQNFGFRKIIPSKLFENKRIPSFIIYNLPDALWIFAFTNLMLLIWNGDITKQSIFWIIITPVIGIFYEIGQFFKLVPGTFDKQDLIFILIAVFLSFLVQLNFTKHKSYEPTQL